MSARGMAGWAYLDLVEMHGTVTARLYKLCVEIGVGGTIGLCWRRDKA